MFSDYIESDTYSGETRSFDQNLTSLTLEKGTYLIGQIGIGWLNGGQTTVPLMLKFNDKKTYTNTAKIISLSETTTINANAPTGVYVLWADTGIYALKLK